MEFAIIDSGVQSTFTPTNIIWVCLLLGITAFACRRVFSLSRQSTPVEKEDSLWEKIPVGVLLLAENLEILQSNETAKQLLDLDSDRTNLFKNSWQLIGEDGTPFESENCPIYQAVAQKSPIRNFVMGLYRPSHGTTLWLLINAYPQLSEDGKLQTILCTFNDISDTSNKQREDIASHNSKADLLYEIEKQRSEFSLTIQHLKSEVQQRRETSRVLQKERKFLNTLLNQLTDGIIACDANGKIALCNPVIRHYYNFSDSQLPQDFWLDEITFCDSQGNPLPPAEMPMQRALSGETIYNQEVTLPLDDGETRTLLISGQPIFDPEGQKLGAVIASHDISDRKRAQEALEQHQEELETLIYQRTQQLQAEIQKHQKTEQALRLSQERYEIAVSGSQVGVWDWDLESNKIYVTPNLKTILGYEEDEIANRMSAWGKKIHPDDLEAVWTTANNYIKGRIPSYEIEHRMLHKDGTIRWFLARGKAIYDEAGTAYRMTGTETDITALKEAEQALRQARDELEQRVEERTLELQQTNLTLQEEILERQRAEEALQNIVSGTASVTAEEFFPALVSHLAKALKVRYALVAQTVNDYSTQTMGFWAGNALQENVEYSLEGTPCEVVLQTGQLQYYPNNLQTLFPHAPLLEPMQAVCYLGVPLFDANQKVVGHLCILHDKPLVEAEIATAIMTVFAARASAELQRVWVEEELRNAHEQLENRVKERTQELETQISERQQAEAALRTSEERWQLAVRGTSDGIWDWKIPTNEVFLSTRWKEMLGYEDDEIANDFDEWENRVHPHDLERCLQALQDHLAYRIPYNVEHRLRCKDGSYKWILTRAQALWDEDGNPIRMTGSHTDISDRKKAEERLRLLESVVVHANDGILVTEAEPIDEPGPRIIYVNEAMTRISGYSRKELIGKTPRILQGDKTKRTQLDEIRTALQNWESVRVELINYRKDGTPFWVELNIVPIADETGWYTHWVSVQRDITERKRVEAELRNSQEQLNSILNSMEDCVWSVRVSDFQYVYMSPATERMYGRPVSEFWNNSHLWLEQVYPEDRPLVEKTSEELLNKGSKDLEYRILRPNGEVVWIRDRASLVRDEKGNPIRIDGIATNITERKHYEEALEQERQHLRQIVENAPVAMAMLNQDFIYLAHSKQWLSDYSLHIDSLIGTSQPQALPELHQQLKDACQRGLKGEVVSHPEDVLTFQDGTKLYLRWTVQPWYSLSREVEGIIIVTQIINELVEARESALEASRLKSQFLANMSHEIRTPMNGVIGMTDLLLRTPINPQQEEFLQTLRLSGQNLLLLINDILDFSKLEAGEMRVEKIDFDLNGCIEQVIDLVAIQKQSKPIELFTFIDRDVPLYLQGDPSRLRQILMNLTGNAIKFTEVGEVMIHVSLVENASPSSPIILRFEIRDTGIGIAEKDRKKLFKSFSQIDSSTTRNYGGTGLGLAISQQLVELMGGEIGVESVLGEGSTFWFTAQFSPSSLIQDSSKNVVDVLNDPSALAGLKLLIIDPNPTSRKIISSYGQMWEMKCTEVASFESAISELKKAARKEGSYNIAVVDLDLLKQQFYLFSEFLSISEESLRWIVMGSIQQHEEVEYFLDAGASDYLLKPLKASRLYKCFRQVIYDPASVASCFLPSSTTKNQEEVSSQLQQQKILLVEDTPINQKVVLNQLQTMGCEAVCAQNGQEALEILEKEDFDLILMDCLMPVLDGYETTQFIRQREGENRHTIIIAMTASAIKGEREKCLAAGMDDYLSKPVEMQVLQEVLSYWISSPGESETASVPSDSQDIAEEEKEFPNGKGTAILDLDRLEELSGGDREFQLDLLETFLEDAPIYLGEIKQAFCQSDLSTVARRAHQLKGASSMVAIYKMPELSKKLELEAEAGHLEDAEELITELEMILTQVETFVESW